MPVLQVRRETAHAPAPHPRGQVRPPGGCEHQKPGMVRHQMQPLLLWSRTPTRNTAVAQPTSASHDSPRHGAGHDRRSAGTRDRATLPSTDHSASAYAYRIPAAPEPRSDSRDPLPWPGSYTRELCLFRAEWGKIDEKVPASLKFNHNLQNTTFAVSWLGPISH